MAYQELSEAAPADAANGGSPVVVGVVAAPGIALDLAQAVAEDLPERLAERFPDFEWHVEVGEGSPAEPSANVHELIDTVRRHLLEGGWHLAVGLTDLPLRSGRRPVTAHASATHGVGLVSVPGMGPLRLEKRLTAAVAALVEGLVGETAQAGDADELGRIGRARRRFEELRSPLGHARARDDGSVRFVGAAVGTNLRLVLGMVRANQPVRVIARLSRAVVGALGAGAFAITATNVWTIADAMGPPRLIAVALLSIVATVVALVVAHDLWQRTRDPRARERVVLFNLATACTLALAVVTMYLALFVIALLAGAVLITPEVLRENVNHGAGVGDYLKIAWLVAAIATIGGALGAMVESDAAVRDAAYRNRADARIEAAASEPGDGP